jgi:histidyl-tRNA synthetase
MAKDFRPKARVAKGFRDVGPEEIRGLRSMMATIQQVYESYGFEPVEQPFIEYTEALGKFLPDQDRPNAGVFSFQDDDEQWLSLRYDLTAPLARYVAENNQGQLPTPYRSYRQGWVFRNEKPGPGRYRQFMQFDADTVGTASPAADAEVCMMAADTMEALGIPRGQYVMKVNSRNILDGALQSIGLDGDDNAHAPPYRPARHGQARQAWPGRRETVARQGPQGRERRFHQRRGTKRQPIYPSDVAA